MLGCMDFEMASTNDEIIWGIWTTIFSFPASTTEFRSWNKMMFSSSSFPILLITTWRRGNHSGGRYSFWKRQVRHQHHIKMHCSTKDWLRNLLQEAQQLPLQQLLAQGNKKYPLYQALPMPWATKNRCLHSSPENSTISESEIYLVIACYK